MQNAAKPLVSIGVPTYNRADALPKSVSSALAQNYPNLEVVISDNGSTDHTQEVCEQLMAQDSRVRYVRIPVNIGPYPNFENALAHAKGKYFLWLDDDDALAPDVIPAYVAFLENNPEYITVCGEIFYYDEAGVIRYKEKGLSLEQNNPKKRVSYYYRKVVQGALWHGLHRRHKIADLPIPNDLAGDWHLIAAIAFRGKIANIDVHGYDKDYEGASTTNYKRWLSILGINTRWAAWPFGRIAYEAFKHVSQTNPAYEKLSKVSRYLLGIKCAFLILVHYYVVFWPQIVGGKLLRILKLPTPGQVREKRRLEAEQSLTPQESNG